MSRDHKRLLHDCYYFWSVDSGYLEFGEKRKNLWVKILQSGWAYGTLVGPGEQIEPDSYHE
jgi:hypothetical protein